MIIKIDPERMLSLLNSEAMLVALERGGVDNWEWYGESLNDFEEITSLSEFNLDFDLRYRQGDTVYYNNTSCDFVTYLSKTFAVVEIELEPDFDIDTSNHCAGCMIGDSDNKIQCKCDEVQGVIEDIEHNTPPTYIPLVVQVDKLYDRPVLVQKHEEEISKLLKKNEEVRESTKQLLIKKVELEAELTKLNKLRDEINNLNNI